MSTEESEKGIVDAGGGGREPNEMEVSQEADEGGKEGQNTMEGTEESQEIKEGGGESNMETGIVESQENLVDGTLVEGSSSRTVESQKSLNILDVPMEEARESADRLMEALRSQVIVNWARERGVPGYGLEESSSSIDLASVNPRDPLNLDSIQPLVNEMVEEAHQEAEQRREDERAEAGNDFANGGFGRCHAVVREEVDGPRDDFRNAGFEQVREEISPEELIGQFRWYLVAQVRLNNLVVARIAPISSWPYLVEVPMDLIPVERPVNMGDCIQITGIRQLEEEWNGGAGDILNGLPWINTNRRLNYQARATGIGEITSGERSEVVGLVTEVLRDRGEIQSFTVAAPLLPCAMRVYKRHWQQGLRDENIKFRKPVRLELQRAMRPCQILVNRHYALPGHSPLKRGDEFLTQNPCLIVGAKREPIPYVFPFTRSMPMEQRKLGEEMLAAALCVELEDVRNQQKQYTVVVPMRLVRQLTRERAIFRFEKNVPKVKELTDMAKWWEVDTPVQCRTRDDRKPCAYGSVSQMRKGMADVGYILEVEIIIGHQEAKNQNTMDEWEALIENDGGEVELTPCDSTAALEARIQTLATNSCTQAALDGEGIMRILLGMAGQPEQPTVQWEDFQNHGIRQLLGEQRMTARLWLDNVLRVIFQQAPPGTGKTRTAACLASATLKNDPNARVLALAPPNIAVAKLVEDQALVQRHDNNETPMLALFSGSGKLRYANDIQRVSPHLLASAVEPEEFIGLLNPAEQRKVKKYQSAVVNNPRVAQEGAVAKILQEHRRRRMCFATLAFAEQVPLLFEGTTHLIIDEAGQAPYSTILTLVKYLPNLKKVLITGDRRQLKVHLVSLPVAIRENLGCDSVIYNLDEAEGVDVTALDVSYRSHSAIVSCIGEAFYQPHNEQLIGAGDRLDAERQALMGLPALKLPAKDVPIMLIHQNDEAQRDDLSTSSSNAAQTDTAMRVMARVCREVERRTIRCICLYAAQALEIERLVRSEGWEDRVLVTTADATQGHEADVVVVVTTASAMDQVSGDRGSPFWAVPDRVNVALSRPRHGLFVIGNFHVLNCAESWSRFLTAAMRLTKVVPPGFLQHRAQEGCRHGDDGVLRWLDADGALQGIVRDDAFYQKWETDRNSEGDRALRVIADIPGNARFRPGRDERQQQRRAQAQPGGNAQEDWPALNAGGPGPVRHQIRGRGRGANGQRPGPSRR